MTLIFFTRNRRGFTLIELLVVIAVMGVLATIVLVAVNPEQQFAKARNVQRKADLRTLANAVEKYQAFHGVYPSTGGSWCTTSINVVGVGYQCAGNVLQTLVNIGTLTKLPTDPKAGVPNFNTGAASSCENGGGNSYLYNSNGTNYKLLAHCTPEGPSASQTFQTTDPFYDPNRPQHAWKISWPANLSL